MNDRQKNKFELEVIEATNDRNPREHLTQRVIDGIYSALKLGSTYKTIQERFKVGKNTVGKIANGTYIPSQEAIDYVNFIRKDRTAAVDANFAFTVDGRSNRLIDTIMSYMNDENYFTRFAEDPMLMLKTLETIGKLTNQQQRILIERSKIKTDTDVETVKAMTDFAKAITGGNKNGDEN